MGKTRDLFKKIRDTKGTFHAKMGSMQDRNGMDLTEAEDIKKRWQEYTEELHKKDLHDQDNQDGGGVGWEEHFLPHKFIKRAFKRQVNSTKQLLNAGREHQAPRKATQLFDRRQEKI